MQNANYSFEEAYGMLSVFQQDCSDRHACWKSGLSEYHGFSITGSTDDVRYTTETIILNRRHRSYVECPCREQITPGHPQKILDIAVRYSRPTWHPSRDQ